MFETQGSTLRENLGEFTLAQDGFRLIGAPPYFENPRPTGLRLTPAATCDRTNQRRAEPKSVQSPAAIIELTRRFISPFARLLRADFPPVQTGGFTRCARNAARQFWRRVDCLRRPAIEAINRRRSQKAFNRLRLL